MRIRPALFIFAAILGVLLFSTIGFNFVRIAQASNPWTGNEDGEFGFPNCDACTVSSGSIIQGVGISGNLNPGDPGASLQWSQDYFTDLSHQYEGGFVQAVISDDVKIQYGQFTMDMEASFPNGQSLNFTYSQRPIIPFMFDKGASWNTFEYTNSKGQIYAVTFQLIQPPQGTVYDYTLGVPALFTWLRTQLCWCGYSVSFPSANFASSSAGQTTESVSGSTTSSWGPIGPPSQGTFETSNMEYSCLFNDGSTLVFQDFSLTDAC
jgi:hypothetical protein